MNNKTQRVILGYRHLNYHRTLEVADFAHKIITGEGYGSLVVSYKPRESQEQKEQRIHITQNRTSSVEEKTSGFLSRVFRADKLKFKLDHSNKNALGSITDKTKNFGPDGQPLIVWAEETALYYNRLDPNSFYWVKHSREDNIDYFEPVIFSSDEVADYELKKGVINYCVISTSDVVSYIDGNREKAKEIELYYYFGSEGLELTIQFDEEVLKSSDYYSNFSDEQGNLPQLEKVGTKTYFTILEPYEGYKIPVSRMGYKYDPKTEQNSYVTYFDGAVPLFQQLANIGSEYDLSLALHTFLQKIQYYTPCKYQHENHSICKGGKLSPSGGVCPSCNGSGMDIHTSSQDVILLQLPDDNSAIKISPKDLAHYVDIPFNIVEHQERVVKEYTPQITETIFGVDLSHQPNGMATATQINNFDSYAQDKLYEFTKAPKRLYTFTIECIADILGFSDGLENELEYSNEYNLESVKYLLEELKLAKDAGASPEIIEAIEAKIVNKQNRTDSAYMSIYNAMRKFLPFAGIEPTLREQIILQLPFSDLQKSLYLNFKQITEEILEAHSEFIALDYNRQWQIVQEFSKKFADRLVNSNSPRTMRETLIEEAEEENLETDIDG